MFNIDKRVRLSEFSELGEIRRDGDFFAVGKLLSRVPARLVPVTSRAALTTALQVEGIAAVGVPEALAAEVPESLAVIVGPDPVLTCFHIHWQLHQRRDHYWTDRPSDVHPSARIHPAAFVAERNVLIGAHTVIDAGAMIGERSVIGERCRIGMGTVIGSDAFELVGAGGINCLQAQAGGVRIGEDSVLLSNSAVARSAFATFTELADNVAIDNLVHVAHDCLLAPGTQVTAGAILAGRVSLGSDAFIGPNATVSNGVDVAEGGHVTIGSTAIRNVREGQKVTGVFAVEHRLFMKQFNERFARTRAAD
jgi:UDP-3-O-[3-hydroxymyristoyl] glucosamine N-acyltransferase